MYLRRQTPSIEVPGFVIFIQTAHLSVFDTYVYPDFSSEMHIYILLLHVFTLIKIQICHHSSPKIHIIVISK